MKSEESIARSGVHACDSAGPELRKFEVLESVMARYVGTLLPKETIADTSGYQGVLRLL
jgi:hypothetical protein